MKLDIKSILILVLLGFSLFFGYSWYFRSDIGYKEKLKQLEIRNKVIEHQKDSIKEILVKKEIEFIKLKKSESILELEIESLKIDILNAKRNANKSKAELDKIMKSLAETRRKIEDLKKNPPNRTGNDLINSIKIKTKK
jgi:peptidoglycan hydrolase CwlO-like protein